MEELHCIHQLNLIQVHMLGKRVISVTKIFIVQNIDLIVLAESLCYGAVVEAVAGREPRCTHGAGVTGCTQDLGKDQPVKRQLSGGFWEVTCDLGIPVSCRGPRGRRQE